MAEKMKRVNAVLRHPLYSECSRKLEELEQGRIFCRHQMNHLLDVARIAYITALEEGLPLEKETIYLAAVLHDIGKYAQYEEGIPHEKAGAKIAEQILDELPPDCLCTPEEKQMILTAILGHRRLKGDAEPLERLLYMSDKASRMCFACPAERECNWDEEKKNMEIEI